MLYIHRSFFAQALLDHPINPLRSPYAPSFLAAYRCASGIIKLSVQHYSRMPDLYGRWWPFWTHLFTAAVRYLYRHTRLSLLLISRSLSELSLQEHRHHTWPQLHT